VTVTNKVALVTGAGSGIGRATALKLLEHGYSVVLTGRRQAPLDELADEARQRGADALAVACDVGDAAGVAALFDPPALWTPRCVVQQRRARCAAGRYR